MSQSGFNHRVPRAWHKITIGVPAAWADTIVSCLASIPVDGVEQIAPPPSQHTQTDTEKITVYLADSPELEQKTTFIHDLIARLNKNLPAGGQALCQTEPIVEQDWNSNWKKHFKPFKLTSRLVIKPSWESYPPQPQELVIEMDPGMAFGTGLHASTKLALLLTEELFTKETCPATVLDVGTGTGILAMSSALFGADRIIGLDNDIDARTAARENIRKNNLTSVSIVDEELSEISGQYDLVIANITYDILNALAKDIVSRLAPGGSLVLSGILAGEQEENIKKIFSHLGLSASQTKKQDEWVGILLNPQTTSGK